MQLVNMAVSKIAVIGDVHSNVLALKASLQSIFEYEANVSPVDIIVFIGDLLTYGVCPNETLSELLALVPLRQIVFVIGNHDQLYKELISGSFCDYYSKMPGWIQESVDYNLSNMDIKMFSKIDFVPYFIHSRVVFSHANFSPLVSSVLDWAYVNSFEDHHDQLQVILRAGHSLGVLGHTHRSRCFSLRGNSTSLGLDCCVNRTVQLGGLIKFSDYPATILNAGSIGQPRDKKTFLDPSWLLVELVDSSPSAAKYISFDYDIEAHLKSIADSGLSSTCIEKLFSFFKVR